MNGYHLFDHVLVSHIVPTNKIHATMFKGANKVFRPVPWAFLAKKQHNKKRSKVECQRVVTRLCKKEQKKRKRLKELGIDYDFKGYTTAAVPEAKEAPEESPVKKQKKRKKVKSTKEKSAKKVKSTKKRKKKRRTEE